MDEKIIRGRDIAAIRGAKNYREWVIRIARQRSLPFTGLATNKDPVFARIDFGRWIADCECGGAEYVDPDDPIFFCLSCGNQAHDGKARRVVFPKNREEIETAVLERRVKTVPGLDAANQALRSINVDGISRSWCPGETVKQLREQHAVAKVAMRQRQEVQDGV